MKIMRFGVVVNVLGFFAFGFPICADEFRDWMDADTKKTIHARLIDRKADKDGQVQLRLLLKSSGKAVWVPAIRLSSPDLAYAEQWVRIDERLTVVADKGTMRSANGNKWAEDRPKGTIKIAVRRSTEAMTLKIFSAIGKEFKSIQIPAVDLDDKSGETIETKALVPATYSVELYRNDGSKLLTKTIEDL